MFFAVPSSISMLGDNTDFTYCDGFLTQKQNSWDAKSQRNLRNGKGEEQTPKKGETYWWKGSKMKKVKKSGKKRQASQ